jgi:hypothetical protein
VEINNAYLIDSREQLEAYNPKNIKKLEMRVGFFDLTFDCDEWGVRVSAGRRGRRLYQCVQ